MKWIPLSAKNMVILFHLNQDYLAERQKMTLVMSWILTVTTLQDSNYQMSLAYLNYIMKNNTQI